MSLLEPTWTPNDRQLRQFGLVSLVALPLLAYLWGGNTQVIGIAAGTGAAVAITGLIWPRAIKPVFLVLMLIAFPIGLAISEVILALVFFGIFTPMGLLFRLIGRDSLQRKLDRQATTYWQLKSQPADAASYWRQWSPSRTNPLQEDHQPITQTTEFETAVEGKQDSLPKQFLQFLAENNKWWLLPIIIVLGLISLLAIFAAFVGPSAPFIYTIF
jgi:Family of unknown function (DUF5989)